MGEGRTKQWGTVLEKGKDKDKNGKVGKQKWEGDKKVGKREGQKQNGGDIRRPVEGRGMGTYRKEGREFDFIRIGPQLFEISCTQTNRQKWVKT